MSWWQSCTKLSESYTTLLSFPERCRAKTTLFYIGRSPRSHFLFFHICDIKHRLSCWHTDTGDISRSSMLGLLSSADVITDSTTGSIIPGQTTSADATPASHGASSCETAVESEYEFVWSLIFDSLWLLNTMFLWPTLAIVLRYQLTYTTRVWYNSIFQCSCLESFDVSMPISGIFISIGQYISFVHNWDEDCLMIKEHVKCQVFHWVKELSYCLACRTYRTLSRAMLSHTRNIECLHDSVFLEHTPSTNYESQSARNEQRLYNTNLPTCCKRVVECSPVGDTCICLSVCPSVGHIFVSLITSQWPAHRHEREMAFLHVAGHERETMFLQVADHEREMTFLHVANPRQSLFDHQRGRLSTFR